jgi:hypothetical protein
VPRTHSAGTAIRQRAAASVTITAPSDVAAAAEAEEGMGTGGGAVSLETAAMVTSAWVFRRERGWWVRGDWRRWAALVAARRSQRTSISLRTKQKTPRSAQCVVDVKPVKGG